MADAMRSGAKKLLEENEMLEMKKNNGIDAVYKTLTKRLQNVYQNNVSIRDRLQNELYEEKRTTEDLRSQLSKTNEQLELQTKINEKRTTLAEELKRELVEANAPDLPEHFFQDWENGPELHDGRYIAKNE